MIEPIDAIEPIDDPTVVAGEVAEGVVYDAPTDDDAAAATTDASPDGEQPAADAAEPTGQAYIAQRLETECNQLLHAINERNVSVNIEAVKQGAQAFAALRILMLAGIVTEQQANIEVLLATRNTLATALQQVEEQRLAAQKPQVLVPNRPNGPIIARR